MATFFNTGVTLAMVSPLFFSHDSVGMKENSSVVLLLLLAICGLLYLLLRAYRITNRHRELTFLAVILCAETFVKIVLLSMPFDPSVFSMLRWLYLVLLAPQLICLTIIWAGSCDYFDGRDLRVLIPLAMLFSVFTGAGSRLLGIILSLGAGTLESFLSLVSGIIGIVLTKRLLSPPRLGNQDGSEEYESFDEFHPTGEVKGARSLMAAWIAIWLFLFGTALYVGFYSRGFKLDTLEGSGHILVIFLLACGMILVARLAERRLLKFQVSIVIFLGLCLVALYVTAVVGAVHFEFAKSVLLPFRECAIIFSWLILEEFCRECNRPFVPIAAITYFQLIIASALIAIIFGASFEYDSASLDFRAMTACVCLTTALLVTVSSFFVVRYGWGNDRKTEGYEEDVRESDGSGASLLHQGDRLSGESDISREADFSKRTALPESSHEILTEEQALETLRYRYGLTKRELDVLRLTMRGHTQKGMADELYLSINSISTYVKTLHAKLHVHSRQEIVDLVNSVISD